MGNPSREVTHDMNSYKTLKTDRQTAQKSIRKGKIDWLSDHTAGAQDQRQLGMQIGTQIQHRWGTQF